MKSFLIVLLLCSGGLLLATSCGSDPAGKPKTINRDELLKMNRENLSRETAMIHNYIVTRKWNMKETATGLRYNIFYDDSGATAKTDQMVSIAYKAMLLDSTGIASASASQPLTFRVGRDNVVSGLHEAVKLLSVGDSARFILPSHLAYGLTGDVNIPGNAPIVYDIEMLKIQ